MHPLLVVITIFSSLLFIIPFSTLVHEAGHAIAIALVTKEPVSIYLGSYGDRSGSIPARIGRFEVWIQKSPLKWKGGLCVPGTTDLSIRKQIWYVLAGPIATLTLFLFLGTLFIALRPDGIGAPFLALFCLYTGLSFLYNIVPQDNAVGLKNGGLTYNDGSRLKSLLAHRRMPPRYFEALQCYKDGDYETAGKHFEALIAGGIKNEDLYRMAVEANVRTAAYLQANAIQKAQISRFGTLNTSDRIQMAVIKIGLRQYDDAIGYLKHLLQLYGPNKYNLNNLGYVLALVGEYDASVSYLSKAIGIDDSFASAYCNRGFAYLQIGNIQEGRSDTDISLKLDPNNGHAHRNHGLYHLRMRNYAHATEAFEKAWQLDKHIPGLNKLLSEAISKLASVNN